jgi:hypothetical protein
MFLSVKIIKHDATKRQMETMKSDIVACNLLTFFHVIKNGSEHIETGIKKLTYNKKKIETYRKREKTVRLNGAVSNRSGEYHSPFFVETH